MLSREELLVKVQEGDRTAHFSLGKIFYSEGDDHQAQHHLEAYERYLREQERQEDGILQYLAVLYIRQNNLDKAKEQIYKCIDLWMKTAMASHGNQIISAYNKLISIGDHQAHFKLGEYYYNRNDLQKAKDHLLHYQDNLSKKNKWSPQGCYLLGKIFSHNKDYARAKECLEKYTSYLDKNGNYNSSVNKLLIEVYQQSASSSEEMLAINKKITELVLKTEDKENAKEYFDVIAAQKPFKLGLLFYGNKDYSYATRSFEKSAQGGNQKAYVKIVEIYHALNSKNSHAKECKKKVKNHEKEIGLICLADLYRREEGLKNYQKSTELYQHFLDSNSTDRSLLGWVHFHLGGMHQKGGFGLDVNLSAAVEHYTRAVENGFTQAYDALWVLYQGSDGQDNLHIKNNIAYLLGAFAKFFCENIDQFKHLTNASHKDKLNFEEAQKLLTYAAEANLTHAQYELAELYQNRGEISGAVILYQKAAGSNHAEACLKLGEIEFSKICQGQTIANRKVIYQTSINYFKKANSLGKDIAVKRLQVIKNQLITALLYEALRHHKNNKWNLSASQCEPYRELLIQIDNKYKDYNAEKFNEEIETEEKSHHTYFGVDLSDNDSDKEDEITFQKNPAPVKQSALIHSSGLFGKADLPQAKNVLKRILEGETYKTDREILKLESKVGKSINPSENVIKDLREINFWRDCGELAKGLKRTTTRFVIAQYRGITYKVTDYSQAARRKHRRMDEVKGPLFSSSVYKAAGLPYETDYKLELNAEAKNQLNETAKDIKNRLLALRNTDHYRAEYKPNKKRKFYEFDNVAHYLQDTYTKDYDKFRNILKLQTLNNEGKEVKDEKLNKLQKQLEDLPDLDLLNDANPFVSTGDIPLHALKYAYGIKPYQGHRHERLRPRWRKDGDGPDFVAERPYSGKVYLTLHTLEEYKEDNPLHIVSLNHLAKVRLDSTRGHMILPERETTFPGYLPEGRIVYTHIAKYPSFKGDYKEVYAVKYGMNKELYDLFREALTKFPPHSDELEMVKILMGEYLCHYHQFRLIDQAAHEASKRGAVLIYVDEFGKLSLNLPPIPLTKGKDQENIKGIRESRIKDSKMEQKQESSESSTEESAESSSEEPMSDDDNNKNSKPMRRPSTEERSSKRRRLF